MILALFLVICVSVSDVYNFDLDLIFGPQTESVFKDYEETAKLLGFRNEEEVNDEDVISTELDIQKQSPMNIEKPNITSKILKAPMRKFVYFTIPKLKADELTDDDDDHEEDDEEEEISFEEIHTTTTAPAVEESPILQEESNDLSLNAEQDIKSELTASDGIAYTSNPLHFILLLTCLLILCHHC